jgi:hypothetical protein
MVGQDPVRDADELRDAAIDAPHARQHVAQVVVEQALHGGQQQPVDAQRPCVGRECRHIAMEHVAHRASSQRSAVSTCARTPTGNTASLTSNCGEWLGADASGSVPAALAPMW